MPLGKLEPLYRYLRVRNHSNAVATLIADMELLAKGGYIRSEENGVHQVVGNAQINNEINIAIKEAMGEDHATNLHVMCQALGDDFYFSMSRVGTSCSKTCLAISVDASDVAKVEYIEPFVFDKNVQNGMTIYSAINTIVKGDETAAKQGFIRYETSFMRDIGDVQNFAMKIDFKMTRAAPLYIAVKAARSDNPQALVGRDAKTLYEHLESLWKA